MKRNLAVLLLIAMLLSICLLAGCGQQVDEATPSPAAEDVAEEPVGEAVDGEIADEPDGEAEAAADSSVYDTSDWTAVTLNVSTSNNETDYSSVCLAYFCDLVRERSGGKIDFQIFYGGTYCSMPEEYDYVSSGALDMIQWNQSFNSDAFPIIAMSLVNVGSSNALDLVNYLFYENEETASIFEEITHNGNIECIGCIPAGYSGFYSRTPVTGWDSFSDITFGTMLNANLWTALGMNVVSCSPADMYESLSRGVIDSCGQALPAAISRMFYEVAPYGLVTGYSAVAYNFTFNLDRWNSFNEDQQALLRECMAETETYANGYYDECEAEWFELWESETGNELVRMTEEDSRLYLHTSYPINYETYLASAQNLGQEELFEVWVDATSDYLGFNVRTGE